MADQVYAVTAYLLHLNGIIGERDILDARTLRQIRMPNRDGFVPAPPEPARRRLCSASFLRHLRR
jgi:cytochrome c